MSFFERCHNCPDTPVPPEVFLLLLALRDAEGNDSININYVDRASCEGIEPAFDCLQDATFETIMKLITSVDECGRCRINLLGNICEECEGRIPGQK
jgi:hypothetical protein